MPSDTVLKGMNAAHRALLKISGGRIGWTAARMPVLELTTVGRKSGTKRSVMLTAPHRIGDNHVIVASKGGEDTHPAWFLNLREQPAVEVSIKGAPARPMRARILAAEERAEVWPRITEQHSNYAGYQKKTDREIPLVVLEPPT